MHLFPPALTIDTTEGFTNEKDIFGRAQLGAGLTNLVSTIADPTVIAVDGQWGSGKTTFLKMWAGELRKVGFPVVYFDAFESDYVEDAFMAIASEIISLAQEKRKAKAPAAKRFVKSAIGASKVLLRSSLKVGVKAATLGVVAATDLEEFAKDISAEASNLTDKYLGALLTQQKQQKDAIQGFRGALSDLPALLSTQSAKTGDGGKPVTKPLIFIIDELDRCRPSFALEILERIKHFFTVPNVHFVLGVHLAQLHNSVIVAYGPDIDAQTYLQKFIHLTLHLIDRGEHRHERTITKFVDHLEKTMEFNPEDQEVVNSTTELVCYVAEQRDLSLRTIERIMTTFAVALAYTPSNFMRPPPILGGLCILKVVAPDLYLKAKRGSLTYAEVREALRLEDQLDKTERIQDWYIKWWRYCTEERFDEEQRAKFQEFLSHNDFDDRRKMVPHVANDIIDRLNPR